MAYSSTEETHIPWNANRHTDACICVWESIDTSKLTGHLLHPLKMVKMCQIHITCATHKRQIADVMIH
jgi:hypothetical protein